LFYNVLREDTPGGGVTRILNLSSTHPDTLEGGFGKERSHT
ncbi:uncharacterized protein METZ01_LOCUS411896, partial [marine metagenome]